MMSAHDSSNPFIVSLGARRRLRDFHDLKGYSGKPTHELTRLTHMLAEIIVDFYIFQKFHCEHYGGSSLHKKHSEEIFDAIGFAISDTRQKNKERYLKLYTMRDMMEVLRLARVYDLDPKLKWKLRKFNEDLLVLGHHGTSFIYEDWIEMSMWDVFKKCPWIFTNAAHATI